MPQVQNMLEKEKGMVLLLSTNPQYHRDCEHLLGEKYNVVQGEQFRTCHNCASVLHAQGVGVVIIDQDLFKSPHLTYAVHQLVAHIREDTLFLIGGVHTGFKALT